MRLPKIKKCPYGLFWLILSIAYALIFTTIEFAGSPVDGFKGFCTLAFQWLAVAGASAGLLGIISLNRWIFALTFLPVATMSAIAAYYRLALGVSITPMVLELALVNDFATWQTVMSWLLILVALLSLAVSAIIAIYRFRYVQQSRFSWIYGIAFMLCILTPTLFWQRLKAPVINRMPYSFGYSIKGYLENRTAVSEQRDTFAETPARCGADSINVVVVIGESLRPDHLNINGYGRTTLPLLSCESNLTSIPDMRTEECFTHLSVPRIVTRADSLHPDRAFQEQSFITLFKKGGYRTIWISNQDATNSYVYFMHEADEMKAVNSAKTLYDYDKWMDFDMLPELDAFMKRPDARKLAVLHAIGSHWWYRAHYPDSLARFKPEINSRIVSELTREQMINSYDNTILATDAFLKQVIDRLRNSCSVLVFISDHGEALGEDGRYLHAEAYDILHHTACMIWYSDRFARSYPDKVRALKSNAGREYRTDNIFHTVLDAGDIRTPVLKADMSILTDPDRPGTIIRPAAGGMGL